MSSIGTPLYLEGAWNGPSFLDHIPEILDEAGCYSGLSIKKVRGDSSDRVVAIALITLRGISMIEGIVFPGAFAVVAYRHHICVSVIGEQRIQPWIQAGRSPAAYIGPLLKQHHPSGRKQMATPDGHEQDSRA